MNKNIVGVFFIQVFIIICITGFLNLNIYNDYLLFIQGSIIISCIILDSIKKDAKKAILLVILFGFILSTITQVYIKNRTLKINSMYELSQIEWNKYGNYELVSDISLKNADGSTCFIKSFEGTLNGNGYTISNLSKPIFCDIGDEKGQLSVVENIFINDLNMNDIEFYNWGVLVNSNRGIIKNVNVSGTIEGISQMGGIVGSNSGLIEYSSFIGKITSLNGYFIGGISNQNYGTISKSYFDGTISGDFYVGGITGLSGDNSTITDCYSKGSITVYDFGAGGISGITWLEAEISQVYVNADIYGDYSAVITTGFIVLDMSLFIGTINLTTYEEDILYMIDQSFDIPEENFIDEDEYNLILFTDILGFSPDIWDLSKINEGELPTLK